MVQHSLNHEKLVSEDKVDFYRENGFVKVDNVLSDDEVVELREYMEEAMFWEQGRSHKSDKKGGSYYRVLNQKVNAWRDHAGLCKYTFHPRISRLALQVSGGNGIRFFHDHILWKMPEDSKETPWHQDFPYWPMNEHGAFSIWIALDDVDEENGCMMFVPKSHKIGNFNPINLADPQDIYDYAKGTGIEEQQPVIARMKAGSCTFHNGLTFHYAHPNKTAKPRRALAIIYMPDGTTYNNQRHVVTDGLGLVKDQPFGGSFFPLVANH